MSSGVNDMSEKYTIGAVVKFDKAVSRVITEGTTAMIVDHIDNGSGEGWLIGIKVVPLPNREDDMIILYIEDLDLKANSHVTHPCRDFAVHTSTVVHYTSEPYLYIAQRWRGEYFAIGIRGNKTKLDFLSYIPSVVTRGIDLLVREHGFPTFKDPDKLFEWLCHAYGSNDGKLDDVGRYSMMVFTNSDNAHAVGEGAATLSVTSPDGTAWTLVLTSNEDDLSLLRLTDDSDPIVLPLPDDAKEISRVRWTFM